ncbi:uncharacterized protein LODBEIA_P24940 [Lodderomyces beijingensis]|uniref:Uncharacterized protein n=1 Tax=Lodderomyces beijingensis TaxID=1775926 RepID=A0ABP0ZM43_9ASCO
MKAEWTSSKEHLLVEYFQVYISQLKDIQNFYSNIDWEAVTKLVGVDDLEFLQLRVDEIFDAKVLVYEEESGVVSVRLPSWSTDGMACFDKEVARLVDEVELQGFKQKPRNSGIEASRAQARDRAGNPASSPASGNPARMPELTTQQRRLSLELMKPRPKLFGSNGGPQMTTSAAAGTTNVNVMANATANDSAKLKTLERKLLNKDPRRPGADLRTRSKRTSVMGDNLPTYILNQLSKPRIVISNTPKFPLHPIHRNPSPSHSINAEISRKSTRMQNLLANSQSLYARSNEARSNEVDSTNVSEMDWRIRYDTEDDEKEYISPDSLARIYGLQFDDDEEENEDEEENDFVDLEESGDLEQRDDDENDYLFNV